MDQWQHGGLDLRAADLLLPNDVLAASELEEAAAGLAALIRRAPAATNRVALLLGNSPLFVASILATVSLGRCAVLLNPALTPSEILASLAISDASLLLAGREFAARESLAARAPRAIGDLAIRASGTVRAWTLDCRESGAGKSSRTGDDEFVVQFTSGVGGAALAIARTFAQASDELTNLIPRLSLTQNDIVGCPAPYFHSFGLFVGLLSSLVVGARIAIIPSFTPDRVAAMDRRYRPTVFAGVPFMYETLARAMGDGADLFSSCRLLISAGATLPPPIGENFRRRFNREIVQLYGTTEAGVIAVNTPRSADWDTAAVGAPLAGRTIRIVDDSGCALAAGQEGEIAVASPAAAGGYLKHPDLSRAKFRDGWYFTGDIGRLDARGRLFISGRKSAFINVAGMKVDPAAVEAVIMASGQARECAVIGVDRPQYGEFIRAYVVLEPGSDVERIRTYCRLHLAAFKMPREFVAIERLPRTASGKILRGALADGGAAAGSQAI